MPLAEQSGRGKVQFRCDRDRILATSRETLVTLMQTHGPRMGRQIWRIMYNDNDGIDEGGLTKDWFDKCIEEMFSPDYGLFMYSDVDNLTYQINPSSGLIQPGVDGLFFWFCGVVLARALVWEKNIPAHLMRPLYKHILGAPITLADLEFVDKELFKSMQEIMAMDQDEIGRARSEEHT